MNKLRLFIVAMAGLILLTLLAFIFGYTVAERDYVEKHKNDRDTIWMTPDTVTLPPIVKDSLIKDPYPYPVPVMVPGDHDTVIDTIIAQIPMTQKHYVYPDTAELWVTGFNTSIDSAVFYTHHETHYIDNTPPERAVRLTLETGIEGIYVDDRFTPALYAEGGLLLWRRVKLSAGFGVSYTDKATKGIVYGKIAYQIK